MSIELCSECERAVDTDIDADCYVYVGNMKRQHKEIVLCEGCRQQREDEFDWREALHP